MKNFLLISLAGTVLTLSSCSSKSEGGMSDAAKKNMEINAAILKMFETGDHSKIGDYIARDAVDHSGPKGDIKGLDSIRAYFNQMGQMMTNMKNDIIKTLADDEYVMSWLKGSGTAKVDLPEWGMKAGQTQTGESVEVSKFKDGKVVEHWTFINAAEMMAMMSGTPPAPPEEITKPVKDSTSK